MRQTRVRLGWVYLIALCVSPAWAGDHGESKAHGERTSNHGAPAEQANLEQIPAPKKVGKEKQAAAPAAHSATPSVDPNEALVRLLEGNLRYVADQQRHPGQDDLRRSEVARGQHPFAAIVSCADSRVPPEIIFDQGLGDLFVVRVAGNIADDAAIGSIEYAVEHLGVGLVVVLGHENCGAVKATLDGGHAPGRIGTLVEAIAPAVERCRGQGGDPVENAVRANVRLVVDRLRFAEPILAEAVRLGSAKVVGARYDLDGGTVEILR